VVVFLLGGRVRAVVVVVVGGISSLLGVGLGGWGRGRERRRRRRWRRLGGGGLVGGVGREVVGRYVQSWAWSTYTYNKVGMGQGARVVGMGLDSPYPTAGSCSPLTLLGEREGLGIGLEGSRWNIKSWCSRPAFIF
jgi:hypothetical protein